MFLSPFGGVQILNYLSFVALKDFGDRLGAPFSTNSRTRVHVVPAEMLKCELTIPL